MVFGEGAARLGSGSIDRGGTSQASAHLSRSGGKEIVLWSYRLSASTWYRYRYCVGFFLFPTGTRTRYLYR